MSSMTAFTGRTVNTFRKYHFLEAKTRLVCGLVFAKNLGNHLCGTREKNFFFNTCGKHNARILFQTCKVKHNVICVADRQWLTLHAKSLASQVVAFRSMFKSHIKLSHLLNGKQNWNSTFFQDVNFCFAWRLSVEMNDQPFPYLGSATIGKRKLGLTRDKFKMNVGTTCAACFNKCHYTGS